MEAMYQSLAQMHTDFYKRLSDFKAKLPAASTPATISSLTSEIAAFKMFTMNSLTNLQSQVELIARGLDNLEMRGRRKILLLHGVAESKEEDNIRVVTEVIKQKIKYDKFAVSDIKRSQPLGRSSGTQKPRPILIKFKDMSLRNIIWFAKTKLKGSGITLSEFLTKTRHDVFMSAREKFGMNNCWTREGNVYVKGPDDKHYRVTSLKELSKISADTQAAPGPTEKSASTKLKRAAAKK